MMRGLTRRREWLWLLGAALAVLIATLPRWAQRFSARVFERQGVVERAPKIGEPAPDFALRDAEGRRWQLAQLRQRRVLLLFFCGCAPCWKMATALAQEAPSWQRVITLVVSHLDPAHVEAFRHNTGLRAHYLADPFGDVGAAYGSESCPRCWVIDEQGRVRYANRSSLDAGPEVVRAVRTHLCDGGPAHED